MVNEIALAMLFGLFGWQSAGLYLVMGLTIAILAGIVDELGNDIRGKKSTGVMEYLGRVEFPYLITLCGHAELNGLRAFLSMGEHQHSGLEDPAAFVGSDEEKLAKFVGIRNEIDRTNAATAWPQLTIRSFSFARTSVCCAGEISRQKPATIPRWSVLFVAYVASRPVHHRLHHIPRLRYLGCGMRVGAWRTLASAISSP